MRYVKLVLICVFFIGLGSFKTIPSGKTSGVKTVVIDAGHGGHDPGCQYGGVKEKNITLAIALKLGKVIKENLKDVNVIYTRETDKFIELSERTGIANKNKADIFISIHCNANGKITVSGTETYTMGLHKTDDNLDVSKRENSVILMEDDYTKKYDGFDPNSPEAVIIFSLYQDAFMEQSVHLASKVEYELKNHVKRSSRGVKQAGFLVLWKTTMPSILIETGFLSNAEERKFLNSSEGQSQIASAIYRALKSFKQDMETTTK